MEFTLKGASKKYRRMRGWRFFLMNAALPAALGIPWYFDFTRTETIICIVGTMLFTVAGHLEMRLKTIQVRLAGMADELDALRGKETDSNLVLELNDSQ